MTALGAAFADVHRARRRLVRAGRRAERAEAVPPCLSLDDPEGLRLERARTATCEAILAHSEARSRLCVLWHAASEALPPMPARTETALLRDMTEDVAEDAVALLLALGLLSDPDGWLELGAVDPYRMIEQALAARAGWVSV